MIQLITEQVTGAGNENKSEYIKKKQMTKKLKNVKMLDESGKFVYRPFHRVEFQRVTLRQRDIVDEKNSEEQKLVDDRFYQTDYKLFKRLLNNFNNSSSQTTCKQIKDNCHNSARHNFVCTGLANVRLKFCSRCGDKSKTHELERYYVDVNQKASNRVIFCYGCMGMCLKFHADKLNTGMEFV